MHSVTPQLDERFPAQPDAVGRARDVVAGFAAAAGAREADLDAVRLAVSEAVTNAVVHGYRGRPGEVRVTAALDGRGALCVTVQDTGCGMREPAEHPGMGFGLGLIAEFTEEMAVLPRPPGTELRMRFAIAGVTARADAAARVSSRAAAPVRRAPGYGAMAAAL